MRKKLLVMAACLVPAAAASADLVVDTALGTLTMGSPINLTGTTVGANSNADIYAPLTFDHPFGEVVYSFTLTETTLLNLTNNEGIFVGSDTDYLVLNSLTTTFDGTNNVAQGFIGGVDEEGSMGVYTAGNYYFSFDTYEFSSEGPFDVTIDLAPAVAAPSAIDLGVAGTPADLIDMNTFGSDFDTEIGLFDNIGNVLATSDDAANTSQSQLVGTLAEGVYYLAVSGWSTDFDHGFDVDVSPTSSSGNLALSVTGTPGATGFVNSGEVVWYSFSIVPEPASAALLALGAIALIRRR